MFLHVFGFKICHFCTPGSGIPKSTFQICTPGCRFGKSTLENSIARNTIPARPASPQSQPRPNFASRRVSSLLGAPSASPTPAPPPAAAALRLAPLRPRSASPPHVPHFRSASAPPRSVPLLSTTSASLRPRLAFASAATL